MFKKGDVVMIHKGYYFGIPNTQCGVVKHSDKKNTVVTFLGLGSEFIKTKHLRLIKKGI